MEKSGDDAPSYIVKAAFDWCENYLCLEIALGVSTSRSRTLSQGAVPPSNFILICSFVPNAGNLF